MTNLVELAVPTPALPTLQASQVGDFAAVFVIDSPLAAELAAAEHNDLRDQIKRIKEQHDKLKRPVLDAGRAIDEFFRPVLTALEDASQVWKNKLAAYEDARRQKEQEAERKAREVERVERERIASEAAERERASKIEAARLRAEALAHAQAGNPTASAEYQQRASQAELAGQQDAQLMLEEYVPPEREAPPPPPSGIVAKQDWAWQGVDIKATCQAIVDGKAPAGVLRYDLVYVNKMVNALKGEFSVPGIVAKPVTTIAAKGRR